MGALSSSTVAICGTADLRRRCRTQIPASQALTIQLLGKEDLTMDDAYESEAKMHQSWLASFALTSPSEGIGAQVKAPLLKRCALALSLPVLKCALYSRSLRWTQESRAVGERGPSRV